MLEAVDGFGRVASPEDQAGSFELRQCGLQPRLRQARNRGQQLVTELSADRSTDLSDLSRGREAVEPRQQRTLQRGRDRQRRQRATGD